VMWKSNMGSMLCHKAIDSFKASLFSETYL
jgi:hypothetical protein